MWLNRDPDLVPEEGNVIRVVKHRFLEYETAGDAHDSAVVEAAIHPKAKLRERRAEDADADWCGCRSIRAGREIPARG